MRIVFYFFILSVIFLQSLMGYSATLISEYRMDEDKWQGVALELKDSNGTSNGTSVVGDLYVYAGLGYPPMPPINISASATNGGLCRVGAFTNNAFEVNGLNVDENPGGFNTVAFWVYWDGADGVIPFGFEWYDIIFLDGFFGFNTAGGDVYGMKSDSLKDKWVHVVAVFNNGDIEKNKIYINGQLQSIGEKKGTKNNGVAKAAKSAAIGGWRGAGQSTWYMFRGYMDEVSLWRGELSSADALQLYNLQSSGKNFDETDRVCPTVPTDITSKLALNYKMDDAPWSGVANEVKDSSGNSNNGTSKNGASIVNSGKICKGGLFDGAGYIDSGHDFSWDKNGKFSMSIWVKPDSVASDMPLISKSGDWEYTLMLLDNGKVGFNYWGAPGNDEMGVMTYASVNAGEWSHIVFTYDNSYTDAAPAEDKNIIRHAKIFINGKNMEIRKLGGSAIGNAFKNSATNTTIAYGYVWPNRHYKGEIDEVKIYDGQALSYDEARQLYELERDGKNIDGLKRNCNPVGTNVASTFNCVDKSGDWSSGTIKTKDSGSSFVLDVVALKDDNGDKIGEGENTGYGGNINVSLGYATDTACSGWVPFTADTSYSMGGSRKTVAFAPLNKVSKELRCRVTDGTNTACSTDRFSVKPSGYELDKTELKAEDFSLTLKAKNGGGAYDGTASISTALAAVNTACQKQSGFLSKKTGGGEPISAVFAADTSVNELLASDIGAVTVTIKDTTWTTVDQPNDCGDSCDVKSDVNITIKPYNLKLSNAQMSDWGYKSKNGSYKTKFSAKSEALSKQGSILQNFSQNCYADDVDVAMKTSTQDANVTYSSAYTKVTSKSYGYDFQIPKTDFDKGVKNFDLYLTLQKDNTKESNPQDINIITLTPSIGSIAYDAYNADKNTTFVYGKFIFPPTVADFASTINAKGYKAFYSDANVSLGGVDMWRVPGMKNWWINSKDVAVSTVSTVISSDSDTLKDDNTTSKLGSASLLTGSSGGEATVAVSGLENKTQKLTLHFAVSDWLWASTLGYGYSFAIGSDCTAHPCGYLDVFDTNTNSGWSGSDTRAIKAVPKSKRKSRIEW